jgi:hypothetical protein
MVGWRQRGTSGRTAALQPRAVRNASFDDVPRPRRHRLTDTVLDAQAIDALFATSGVDWF